MAYGLTEEIAPGIGLDPNHPFGEPLQVGLAQPSSADNSAIGLPADTTSKPVTLNSYTNALWTAKNSVSGVSIDAASTITNLATDLSAHNSVTTQSITGSVVGTSLNSPGVPTTDAFGSSENDSEHPNPLHFSSTAKQQAEEIKKQIERLQTSMPDTIGKSSDNMAESINGKIQEAKNTGTVNDMAQVLGIMKSFQK